ILEPAPCLFPSLFFFLFPIVSVCSLNIDTYSTQLYSQLGSKLMALAILRERLQLLMPIEGEECWLKEMRGNLAILTTIVASITFLIGLNPPGGVIQSTDNGSIGQSVFAMADSSNYQGYLLANSLSFYSSIVSCIWLISGAPVRPGFPSLLLSTLMSVSLSLLAISYSFGAFIVIPHDYHVSRYVFNVFLSFFAVLAILFPCGRFLLLLLPTTPQDMNSSSPYIKEVYVSSKRINDIGYLQKYSNTQ
ncbi:hypothetical protein S83_037742, partial [Arachis hypogaea]